MACALANCVRSCRDVRERTRLVVRKFRVGRVGYGHDQDCHGELRGHWPAAPQRRRSMRCRMPTLGQLLRRSTRPAALPVAVGDCGEKTTGFS